MATGLSLSQQRASQLSIWGMSVYTLAEALIGVQSRRRGWSTGISENRGECAMAEWPPLEGPSPPKPPPVPQSSSPPKPPPVPQSSSPVKGPLDIKRYNPVLEAPD